MTDVDAAPEFDLPAGFSFSSIASGIKASGRRDLALLQCAPSTRAAAVFTKNRVVAAPVIVGRDALKKSGGRIRAVVVNAGNANCATGDEGLRSCNAVCEQTAQILGVNRHEIFPSSTGIIGVPLPVEKILAHLPDLIAGGGSTNSAARDFAHTIMTTDTRPKVACERFQVGQAPVRVLGIAKGSGMIHPQLATILVYLMTDISAFVRDLKRVLKDVCDQTFNYISVDGDTSTNDTLLLLASGKSHANVKDRPVLRLFHSALMKVCQSLAEQIVRDGEGVNHVIHLQIEGAKNRAEAEQVARAIAHSPLVKTAWAGSDPNWGRILAAVGRSGVLINPQRISIFVGDQKVCDRGQAFPFNEKLAHQHLRQAECEVRVRLGRGHSNLCFLTTDLTSEYVRINADYST